VPEVPVGQEPREQADQVEPLQEEVPVDEDRREDTPYEEQNRTKTKPCQGKGTHRESTLHTKKLRIRKISPSAEPV
jgi:hypothetical protein